MLSSLRHLKPRSFNQVACVTGQQTNSSFFDFIRAPIHKIHTDYPHQLQLLAGSNANTFHLLLRAAVTVLPVLDMFYFALRGVLVFNLCGDMSSP